MQGHCEIIEHFKNVLYMNVNVNIMMHQIIKLPMYFSVLFVGDAGHTFTTQCKEHFTYNKKKRERFRWKHHLSLL